MDSIILIAQQLSNEGKVPTTAQLKARLPKDIPLAKIIKGLTLWKENPHKQIDKATSIEATATHDMQQATSIDALLDARIAQVIAPLRVQIKQLQTELANLQQLIKEDKK